MTSPGGGFDLIVLSPHLDDAILSCGGRIAATTAAGGRALVVTPFAGDDPAQPPGALAQRLRALWDLPAGAVVAARRREDLEACARLEAEAEHGALLEALYRTAADGRALYPTLAGLFGPIAAADRATVDQVTASVRALPATRLLLAPLAVGGHVDHRLLRLAAESSAREVAFYEEFPYTEWKWFAVRRALGGVSGWSSETLPLTAEQVERRQRAILAYASQVASLFRSAGRLGRQLRRSLRRTGGERIWRHAR